MYKVMTEGENLKGMQKNSVISSKTKDFLKEKYSKCDFCIIKPFQNLEKNLLEDREIKVLIEFKDDEFVIKHLIRYKNKRIDLKVISKEKIEFEEFESTSNIRLKNKADEKNINIILCGIVSRLFVMQELLFDYVNTLKAARK